MVVLQKPVAKVAFPVTDRTLIAAADVELGTGPAYGRFCELYWYPVYAFICRSWPGLSRDEVVEATQEFFTVRLEKHDLGRANEFAGRFHHWIMGAVTHLLANRRKHEHAQMRDRRKLVWLDALTAEARLRLEPKTTLDPLRLFERDVALGVLERALERRTREYAARNESAYFARAVRLIVPGEADSRYLELELRWGLPPNTLKGRVHRLRGRLGQLVGCELGVPAGDLKAQAAALAWLFQALDRFEPDREPGLPSKEGDGAPDGGDGKARLSENEESLSGHLV
jgi:hypothetical protein